MKVILVVLIFLIFGVNNDEQGFLLSAIDQSDFVGFFYRDDTIKDPVYIATEVFKGDIYYLADKSRKIQVADDRLYLVVGNVNGVVLTDLNYLVKAVDDLSSAEIDILQQLPCYDEAVKNAHQNGFCTKENNPVCGCDNKVYGNICFLKKQGIMKFKPGECQE